MVKTKEEELPQDGQEAQQLNSLHRLAGAVLLQLPVETMPLLEEPLAFSTLRQPLASLTPRRAPEELLVFLRSESVVPLQLPPSHHQDFPLRLPAGL